MAAPPIADRHLHHFHRRSPIKESVRVASTANITLSGTQTIDGIAVIAEDRVLVKSQSSASGNGVYRCQSGAWVRDYDVSTDDPAFGYLVYVREGTTNGGTLWKNTNTSAPTVGSTSLTFAQFTSGGFTDPMTTRGDVIIRNASNVTARLGRGSSDTFLGSDGTDLAWGAVTDAKLSTSDITTNNVTTSKHGFAPRAPNDTDKFLRGDGSWAVVPGSTGGGGGGATDYFSGATGTGQVKIPGLYGDARVVPVSPSGSDQEFDAALSTGTTVGAATAENADSLRRSNYYVKRASTTTSLTGRYWAWSPSAGSIATTYQTGFDAATRAGNARSGLAIAASSPSAYETWGIGWSGSWGIRVDAWSSATAYASTPFNGSSGYVVEGMVAVYFRVRFNSSTSVDFEYSYDGFLWHSALAGHNPGFAVGAVGLLVDPESSDVQATWDFLRFS